jgi:spermidine synthase
MAVLPDQLGQRVAAVGLGAGAVACYARPGQEWTFYEIDPEVERIARDPKCFTYLGDCAGVVKVVLGDARLSLQRVPDGYFGLMILDAYNSDTIPLHLITREALALYLQKLASGGILAFHITNRHLDLEPLLADLAEDAGLAGLYQHDVVGVDEFTRTGRMESRWVLMCRNPLQLRALSSNPRWQPLQPRATLRIWTDDYASVFSVFAWQ